MDFPIDTLHEVRFLAPITKPRAVIVMWTRRWVMAGMGLSLILLAAGAEAQKPQPVKAGGATQGTPVGAVAEVVTYVSDLPKQAFHEFDVWKDPATPGGKMAGITNNGDELDPPPENDPHVSFKVNVRGGVPYRCWLHMKVGKPKGKSQANMVYAQFAGAVDKLKKETLAPGSGSYLTLRGPAREGWVWVGRDMADPKSAEPLIYFRTSGEITVRLQAGMEGVGFDQLVLSPARFLEKPPAEAVVKR